MVALQAALILAGLLLALPVFVLFIQTLASLPPLTKTDLLLKKELLG